MMENVRYPLSGDVNQIINPMSFVFGNSYSIGPITVNLGHSSDADLEKGLVGGTASYGRQLGIIEVVILVILDMLVSSPALKDCEELATIKADDPCLAHHFAMSKAALAKAGHKRHAYALKKFFELVYKVNQEKKSRHNRSSERIIGHN